MGEHDGQTTLMVDRLPVDPLAQRALDAVDGPDWRRVAAWRRPVCGAWSALKVRPVQRLGRREARTDPADILLEGALSTFGCPIALSEVC